MKTTRWVAKKISEVEPGNLLMFEGRTPQGSYDKATVFGIRLQNSDGKRSPSTPMILGLPSKLGPFSEPWIVPCRDDAGVLEMGNSYNLLPSVNPPHVQLQSALSGAEVGTLEIVGPLHMLSCRGFQDGMIQSCRLNLETWSYLDFADASGAVAAFKAWRITLGDYGPLNTETELVRWPLT